MKFNLLFLGTPTFAIPILERLHEEHNIIAVVTQPDKPVGRKQILTAPPIKVRAKELGLAVLQPEKISEILDPTNPKSLKHLNNPRVDFLVTAAYGQYLPTKVLELPFKDALNVHPSLLPRYRGATPMQSALLNGDEKTGVSIIRMVKEMDAGPIYMQQQFPLPSEWKYPELEKHCAEVGADLISSVISNCNSLSPQDQPSEGISHCSKISKQDGDINWSEETAEQILNKLRAFTPWPGVFTFWKGTKLSLLNFESSNENNVPNNQQSTINHPPGSVTQEEGKIFIQCKESAIALNQLQLAGKKPTDPKSFTNGYPDFVGTQLGKI
jgi:methionyl-tRNA formyltransferase